MLLHTSVQSSSLSDYNLRRLSLHIKDQHSRRGSNYTVWIALGSVQRASKSSLVKGPMFNSRLTATSQSHLKAAGFVFSCLVFLPQTKVMCTFTSHTASMHHTFILHDEQCQSSHFAPSPCLHVDADVGNRSIMCQRNMRGMVRLVMAGLQVNTQPQQCTVGTEG